MTTDQQFDPLSVTGAVEDVQFPVIPKNTAVRCKVEEVALGQGKPSAENPAGTRWIDWRLSTTTMAFSTDQKPVHPGHRIACRIFLDPSEKRTAADVASRLSMPLKAIFGRDAAKGIKLGDLIANPALVVGKLVDVKVGIESDRNGQFPDKNNVGTWIIPA